MKEVKKKLQKPTAYQKAKARQYQIILKTILNNTKDEQGGE